MLSSTAAIISAVGILRGAIANFSLVLNGLQAKNNKVENFYDHFLEDMAKQYFISSYFVIRTFSFVFQ